MGKQAKTVTNQYCFLFRDRMTFDRQFYEDFLTTKLLRRVRYDLNYKHDRQTLMCSIETCVALIWIFDIHIQTEFITRYFICILYNTSQLGLVSLINS